MALLCARLRMMRVVTVHVHDGEDRCERAGGFEDFASTSVCLSCLYFADGHVAGDWCERDEFHWSGREECGEAGGFEGTDGVRDEAKLIAAAAGADNHAADGDAGDLRDVRAAANDRVADVAEAGHAAILHAGDEVRGDPVTTDVDCADLSVAVLGHERGAVAGEDAGKGDVAANGHTADGDVGEGASDCVGSARADNDERFAVSGRVADETAYDGERANVA